ncbi:MAG: AraC family transcriptional regulator [Nevskia sp.]|nr:AraC family transcriptional regulator [Nevskia sp.]
MPGTLVRSIILSGAAQKIRESGKRPGAIAAAAGIPAAALRDADLLISGRAVIRFFDIAARTCRRRNWGLEMSAGTRLAAVIGPLWVLLRNARTVGEMCEDLARNYDLYSSAALMSFESSGGGAILGWSAASGQADNEVQIAEFALATVLGEVRSHGPPDWTPTAVWFRHEAPRDLRTHRRLFGPNLHFNSDRNAIHLDGRILGRPLRGNRPGNRTLVRNILRNEEGVLVTAAPLQVEGIVRTLLPFAPCGIKDVAVAMGLSVRSLQERLKASDQSFRSIKDAVRCDLAGKYLKHSEMSATQIAGLLAYSDLSSLSRSFRRWHDRSVRATRRPREKA